MVIVNILVFIISLSVVIILHELGHFVMARRAGILCHEFSLGMGPVLWKTKKGETVYAIRAIPIGGFVMMAGEEIDEEFVKVGTTLRLVFENQKVSKIILDHKNEKYDQYELITVEKVDLQGQNMKPLYINEYEVKRNAMLVFKDREMQIAPYERGFNGKTKWQRFGAIFGGPFMNFVLAFFVFLVVNLIVGFPNMNSSEIGFVGPDTPAEQVLKVGDEITAIDGKTVENWYDLSTILGKDPADRNVTLSILRDGQPMDVNVMPIIYFYNIGFHSDPQAGLDLIIGDIVENSKADQAGFKAGDELVKVNGMDVYRWDDVVYILKDLADEPYEKGRMVPFEVLRDGNIVDLSVSEPYTAAFLASQNMPVVESKIGISPTYHFHLGQSFVGSFENVGTSSMMIFTTIGLLFDNTGAGAGIGISNLAGPVGIYSITSAALSQGFISLLTWIGLLSVNLGIINLLPIPALDGGRLVFLGYEAIARRKPNKKIENTLHYVMYLALMGLFVFITFNDILRLFNLK